MDESEANSSTEDVLRNLGLFTREGELKMLPSCFSESMLVSSSHLRYSR